MSNQPSSKFLLICQIILALFCCFAASLGIYLLAVPFIYGAWHCPHPPCDSPDWIQWTVFLILLSPLLVFAVGAYLCRNIVASLTAVKILRVVVLFGFAAFPLILFAALIIYIVNSP